MEILRRFRARGIIMPYPHQDVMLHIQEHDRQVLMRRRARQADIKPDAAEELSPEPDDDKLLP